MDYCASSLSPLRSRLSWPLILSSSPSLFFLLWHHRCTLAYIAFTWEGDALCFPLPTATTSTTFNDTLLGNSYSRTAFSRTSNSEHPKNTKAATAPSLWPCGSASATLFPQNPWRQPVRRSRRRLSALKLFGMSLSRQPFPRTPSIFGFLNCDMVQTLLHRQEYQGWQGQQQQYLEHQEAVLKSPRSI